MISRTVEVSTDGTYLSLRNGQLVLKRDAEDVGTVPFEDLGVLILAARQMTVSRSALAAAAEAGTAVVVCGENLHPAALLLPIEGNTLHAERLRAQIAAKKPLHKQLWRQIVRAKIERQAAALDANPVNSDVGSHGSDPVDRPAETGDRKDCYERRDVHRKLLSLARRVRSGDPDNVEAQAARVYWQAVFGQDFRRDRHGFPPNNLLNYGYAIVRAAVARAICGAGLHPALGIQHSNRYNAFCLADDLMEPYRPYVDARVRGMVGTGHSGVGAIHELPLDTDGKRRLLEVLTDPVGMGGERSPLAVAVQRTASSLAQIYLNEREELELPMA